MTMIRWERRAAQQRDAIKWQIIMQQSVKLHINLTSFRLIISNDKSHIESFVCCAYRSPT